MKISKILNMGRFKEKNPIIIRGEAAKKITRWLRGEFTPEEIEAQKRAEERFKKAREIWGEVVWKDKDMENINNKKNEA